MSTNENLTVVTLHGVFLEILGLGVLLKGTSGVGKSELALVLINRGFKLIADDAVDFVLHSDGNVLGHCHPILQDFLEVRGLGPLNIRAMFGDSAIKNSHALNLIVNIRQLTENELVNMDRVHGMYVEREMFHLKIPEVTIPVSPGRNLAYLVEGAVRNQLLRLAGYNASEELCKRQLAYMEEMS
jgi:HPr kinase/phosphorylase